jgi:hypothetical protein
MKANQSNPGENPSASSPSKNPCLDIAPAITALNVLADSGVSYLLPYAQFLYAEKICNPALEKEPDAPPEKIRMIFAQAEVVILGSGLKRLEREIQKCELEFVKAADRRLAPTLNTHIATVTVTLAKESV